MKPTGMYYLNAGKENHKREVKKKKKQKFNEAESKENKTKDERKRQASNIKIHSKIR